MTDASIVLMNRFREWECSSRLVTRFFEAVAIAVQTDDISLHQLSPPPGFRLIIDQDPAFLDQPFCLPTRAHKAAEFKKLIETHRSFCKSKVACVAV